jgi:hypothetical protein
MKFYLHKSDKFAGVMCKRENSRMLVYDRDDGDIGITLKIMDGDKTQRSLYEHKRGIDITHLSLSVEGIKALHVATGLLLKEKGML